MLSEIQSSAKDLSSETKQFIESLEKRARAGDLTALEEFSKIAMGSQDNIIREAFLEVDRILSGRQKRGDYP